MKVFLLHHGRLPACALALALTACATPPTRFHSLLPPPAEPAAVVAAAAPGWQLLPVSVAVAVDRPQWVLRREDGSMDLLEQERWIAPLGDEVHAALSLHLTQLTAAAPAPGPGGPWRIALELRRWDAMLGRSSRLEALWSLEQSGPGAPPRRYCRAVLDQPASAPAAGGERAALDALGQAHRAVLRSLAEAIAASFKAC